MRELLHNAGFRRLWASVVAVSLGDALAQMALLELFHRHQYDERVETAKLLFAVALPGLLFGPVAMAYLDRWQRRSVLLASDAFRSIVALGMVVWVWGLSGQVQQRDLLVIYGLIFVIGTVATFYLPARVSLLPNLVLTKKLMPANTLFASSVAVAAVGGRAVGGALAELCGPMPGLFANVVAYGVSVLCVWGIRMLPHNTSQDRGEKPPNGWRELRDGLAYLWGHPLARRLVFVAGAFAFVAGLLLVEMVGYAMDTLGLGTGGVGYLVGAGGAGAALGMAICARNPAWARADWLTPVQLTLVGLALLGLGWSARVWQAVPLVVFMGAAAAMVAIHVDSKLQEHVEETRRGAVFAARGMLTSLTTVVAFWLQFGTVVLKETPAPVVLCWLGGGTLVAGAIALATMRGWLNPSRR